MDVEQFSAYIVKPALRHIGLYSFAAEQLVTGTALTESKLVYLKQLGRGPAMGLFQMEPKTCEDILKNFVSHQLDLKSKLMALVAPARSVDGTHVLQHNLLFAAAMCRIHYSRRKEPLPKVDDLEGMSRYWKLYYNTPLGAGRVEHFLEAAKPVLSLMR